MEDNDRERPQNRMDRGLMVGIIAIAINIITVSVYVFQTRIMQREQHATVWPYLEWRVGYNQDDGFALRVANKGVGPALIVNSAISLDGEEIQELDTLLLRMVGKTYFPHLTSSVDNRVLPAGESIYLLRSGDPMWGELLFAAFQEHDFDWSICYESIYGEQWQCLGTEVVKSNCR